MATIYRLRYIIFYIVLASCLLNQSTTLEAANSDSVLIEYIDTLYQETYIQSRAPASSTFFDSLATKKEKSWITRTLYSALIRNSSTSSLQHHPELVVRNIDNYLGYEGRIIRKIHIVKKNITSIHEADTSISSLEKRYKELNGFHINTQSWRIRQQIHFKEGDYVDPQVIADDERMLRSLAYINEAYIYVEPSFHLDSVEVVLILKDNVGIELELELEELGRFSSTISQRNFLGLGFEFGASAFYDEKEENPIGYGAHYLAQNIWQTHSNVRARSIHTDYHEYNEFKLYRPFQSRETRFGGAAEYFSKWEKLSIEQNDSIVLQAIDKDFKNLWLGYVNFVEGNVFNEIVLAGRIYEENFFERPEVDKYSYYQYHNKLTWLQALKLRNVRYLSTNFVKSHGVVEDIPYGQIAELVSGYESAEFFKRLYLGGSYTLARYNMFLGYWKLKFAAGSFWDRSPTQGVVAIEADFFSRLMRMNRWYMRNFVSFRGTYGVNRYSEESILAKETLPGLPSRYLRPFQSKSVIEFESVLFAPWNLAGFQFAFTPHINYALVGTENYFWESAVPIGGAGMGINIRNDKLVFQNLSIRATYFIKTELYPDHFGGNVSTSSPRQYGSQNISQPEIVPLR